MTSRTVTTSSITTHSSYIINQTIYKCEIVCFGVFEESSDQLFSRKKFSIQLTFLRPMRKLREISDAVMIFDSIFLNSNFSKKIIVQYELRFLKTDLSSRVILCSFFPRFIFFRASFKNTEKLCIILGNFENFPVLGERSEASLDADNGKLGAIFYASGMVRSEAFSKRHV